MSIKPIVTFPVASLKSKARPVTEFNDELRQLAADMIETMHAAPGVGLAAPQIGVPLRVVVIAGRVACADEEHEEQEEQADQADWADRADQDRADRADRQEEPATADQAAPEDSANLPLTALLEERIPSLVLVNPEMVAAEGQQVDEEGCLSVLEYATNVTRFFRIRVKAQDLAGNPLDFEAEDFFARVIQHELDHLDGTLFIDRISTLKRALYRKKLKKILQAEES